MSIVDEASGYAGERAADAARDALARDLAGITHQARSAVGIAESMAVRGTSIAPFVAAGIGVASVAAFAAAGGTLAKLAARAAAGMLAGIAGGFAMNQLSSAWQFVEKSVERGSSDAQEKSMGSGGDPATVKAAEALVGPIDDARKSRAGTIAHYTMSAVTGLVYEFVYPSLPLASAGHGLAYGAAVWALADETAVPALGLAEPPWRSPVRTHTRALIAHLVYGATVDLLLRGARRALD